MTCSEVTMVSWETQLSSGEPRTNKEITSFT